MIVVDSSAAVEWLLGLPLADAVADRIASAESVHVPALLDIEVAHVVRRYCAAGEISEQVGERALSVLAEFDAVRYTHELLLPLIWRLRHNLTAYDAAFVALATVLDAPLVTLDERIARAPWSRSAGREIRVDLIAPVH